MSILINKDKTELFVETSCIDDSGIKFKIDKDDYGWYCIMTYTNDSFYREQDDKIWKVIYRKLKKIWAIIRNKDFYYYDISLNKEDFDTFRDYINSIK